MRESLRLETDDVDDSANPFAVPGPTVVSDKWNFAAALVLDLCCRELGRCGHRGAPGGEGDGLSFVAFPLHVEAMAHVGQYVTYSNDPTVWPTGLVDRAAASFLALRTQLVSQG